MSEKTTDTAEIPSASQTQMLVQPSMFVQRKLGNWENLKSEYEIADEKLGEGCFGSVEVVKLRGSGIRRAMKKVDMSVAGLSREDLLKEIDILKNLDHPNILKIYEFYEDSKYLYIITELCQGKELFDVIVEKENETFSEQETMKIIQQALSALQYAHSLYITHRDIKPENIMIDTATNKIKIIDWGTSTSFKDVKINQMVGSAYYIAPEILKKRGYDNKVDIWSLGIVMYMLLTGEPPFDADNTSLIFDQILTKKVTYQEEIWSKVSSECLELNKKMLTVNPAKRITAQQALQHPWFTVSSPSKQGLKLLKDKLVSLKTFKYQSKLQMATIQYVASHLLSQTEKDELSELFVHLDTNKDGRLSREEILEGYAKLNGRDQAEKVVDSIFAQVDTDQSGTIDYNEFLACTMNQQKMMSSETLKRAFKLFDVDGDGSITAAEIKGVLQSNADQFDNECWEAVVKEVDRDGNGVIDFQEFCEMMDVLVQQQKKNYANNKTPFQTLTRAKRRAEETYYTENITVSAAQSSDMQEENDNGQQDNPYSLLQVAPSTPKLTTPNSKAKLSSPLPKSPQNNSKNNNNNVLTPNNSAAVAVSANSKKDKVKARKEQDRFVSQLSTAEDNEEVEDLKETPQKSLKKK